MSEADAAETTVATDEVVVEKSYEFERYGVPAVRLSVRSRRADPATVRVSDPLPLGVSGADVGLHAEHGKEVATVEDGAVRLELDLATDETFTAVYGLRNVTADDLAAGPPAPDVSVRAGDGAGESESAGAEVTAGADDADEIQPIEPTDSAAEASDRRSSRENPSGEESVGANSGGSAAAASEPVEDGVAEADGWTRPDTDPAPEGASRRREGTESLAAALAAEVRTGAADESDVAMLREALDVESGGSTEAQLRDLQSGLADLRAYTDGLEAFLDENGTADQLLGALRADVERLDAALVSATDRLSDHDDQLAAVEREAEAVRSDVGGLHAELEELRGSVAGIQGRLDTVAETGVNMEDDLGATRKRLGDLEERLEDGLGRLDGRVEDVVDEVDALRGDLSDARQETPDSTSERLAALEDDVDGLADAVDEVADVQERLQSVFADGADDE